MTTAGTDQEVARLQQENAALWQKLKDARQRKQENACRKARLKLAKIQEQMQALNNAKGLMQAHLIPDPRFISTND